MKGLVCLCGNILSFLTTVSISEKQELVVPCIPNTLNGRSILKAISRSICNVLANRSEILSDAAKLDF